MGNRTGRASARASLADQACVSRNSLLNACNTAIGPCRHRQLGRGTALSTRAETALLGTRSWDGSNGGLFPDADEGGVASG